MKFTSLQRRHRLAARHRLTESTRTNKVPPIAESLVAVHSSDPATVYLSLGARMKKPSLSSIAKSIEKDRTLVRHHAMRRTIWVMTTNITRLAHAAATCKIAKTSRRDTLKALSKSDQVKDAENWLNQATQTIRKLLSSNGPMLAREIGKALPELVFPIEFGSGKNVGRVNAHTKVLQEGGFDARFVRGAAAGDWISAEYYWSVTEDWLGEPIAGCSEENGARELLRHWLDQFGPASLVDIRWWFGWTARLAKDSLQAIGAEEVQLDDGTPGWVNRNDLVLSEDPGPWVQLLPGLDATTMGWKERDWYLDPELVPFLFDRFGNAGPTIWADGQVVGGWIQKADGTIAYELTKTLDRKQKVMLNDAIERVSDFVSGTVVRPRFPSRNQKQLLASK